MPHRTATIPIHSYGVSVFVLRPEGNSHAVLLLRRSGQGTLEGTWCQVAGAVQPGEKAWQTALRELREETGLVPRRLYSADVCEQFYDISQDRIEIVPVFVAFVDAGQEVSLNDEHTEYRWASFREAADLLPFSGQRAVLTLIRQEFVERKPNEHLQIKLAP